MFVEKHEVLDKKNTVITVFGLREDEGAHLKCEAICH